MGGAKNCPETPRQKMIGMMYLVLTAMLALNVSTDILSGFAMVDTSLHASIEASNKRNESMYVQFKHVADKQKEKAGALYEKALEVKVQADSLYNYIQKFKEDLAVMADGQEKFDQKKAQGIDPTLHIEGNSNMDVTGTYALVQGDGQRTNGQILKDNVAGYSNFLTNVITSVDTAKSDANIALCHTIQATLATGRGYNAHDQDSVDWEVAVFDGMPIGASMAVLSKMQNDVRTTEGQIVQFLMSQIGQSDLSVNKMDAYVIPNSRNVLQGGTYSAQIILAAVDTTQTPEFYVNNVKQPCSTYTEPADKVGLHEFSGYIVVTNPKTNKVDTMHFTENYLVTEPSATISNTELNVMYREYGNKFSVSVPGVTNDKISVSAPGASVQAKGNEWIITPPKSAPDKITITVNADVEGKSVLMGKQEYRVKTLPPPSVYFLGSSGQEEPAGSNVPLAQFRKGELVASYGRDGLLAVPWKVTSFSAVLGGKTYNSNSNKFTSEQLGIMEKLDVGTAVLITEIWAVGAGGSRQRLQSVAFVLK